MKLKGKKVLVTGADGFIGSHLTEKLCAMGAEVKALSYYNSFNSWGWLDSLDKKTLKNIQVVSGDVRDPDFVRSIVKGSDVVFHLAALIAIPFSYAAPDSYIQTNVTGTLNVMQAVREFGVSKVVHTSTSEVYGTAIYVPIDEKHPLQPQSPYSASKIGADMLAMSFYNSFNIPLAVIRPFNTFGPRQSMRAVIPTVIVQALAGRKEVKLGALSPRRDFNYVKNTVEGFVKIAQSDKTIGEIINIASGKEYSIGETVDLIKTLTGAKFKVICESERLRPEKSEVERLLADTRKASDLLGYVPPYTFEEGLKETIEWFKSNMHHYKADIYNV